MMRRRVGRPGLIGTMARTAVVAGTATAVAKGVSGHMNREAQEEQMAAAYQAEQAAAAQQAAAAPAAAPSAPAVDVTTELQKLADLKAQGVLTEEEFAAQKAKILAS
jgi:hypothetical protein